LRNARVGQDKVVFFARRGDRDMNLTLKIAFPYFYKFCSFERRLSLVVSPLIYFSALLPLQAEGDCEGKFDAALDKFVMETRYMAAANKASIVGHQGDLQKTLEILRTIFDDIDKGPREDQTQKVALLPSYIKMADDLNEHDVADDASKQLLDIYDNNCHASDVFFISWLLKQVKERGDVGSVDLISELYRRAIGGLELQDPPHLSDIEQVKYDFGVFLLDKGKAGDAFVTHSEMLDTIEKQIGRSDERFGGELFVLAAKYQDADAYGEADKLLTRLKEVVEDPAASLPLARIILTYDGRTDDDRGRLFVIAKKRYNEGEAAFVTAFELGKGLKDVEPATYATATRNLQKFRQISEMLQDDTETAELRKDLAHAEGIYGTLDRRTFAARKKLVDHLQRLGRASAVEAMGEPNGSTPAGPVGNGILDDLLKKYAIHPDK
jgi:hypothetical protein